MLWKYYLLKIKKYTNKNPPQICGGLGFKVCLYTFQEGVLFFRGGQLYY